MFALFNLDKKFIGYSPETIPGDHILTKQIPPDQQDLNLWKWSGDFSNGKMVSVFEQDYPEEEFEEEKKRFKELNESYPLGIQLTNIIRQLKKIADKFDVQDDRFMDMAEKVLYVMDKQDERIKYILAKKKFTNYENE